MSEKPITKKDEQSAALVAADPSRLAHAITETEIDSLISRLVSAAKEEISGLASLTLSPTLRPVKANAFQSILNILRRYNRRLLAVQEASEPGSVTKVETQ